MSVKVFLSPPQSLTLMPIPSLSIIASKPRPLLAIDSYRLPLTIVLEVVMAGDNPGLIVNSAVAGAFSPSRIAGSW